MEMATILKRPPQHFKNLDETQNAINFAFALSEQAIEVEVSSVIENGERVMILRCTNGKEAAFRKLCEKHHPEAIADDSILWKGK